ncbi:Si-specific NAD(P)(+) transhydrogenase [Mariprofundus ferrooxydans]|uniref:Soluble pyridine nucleotide transhydrogenase n=1 Tax=Mariprofundus ferrooxydans PV-1 TaxID=314345 RepID=Q0F0Y4_9PROT|nr:Si-specific NAD(P)(+) transhydrogenase [Mariprofundus ferrooxydans]EAU55407.1 soluble pyridine nucleotide transhydrogenase [Mariprofundus ferrooxydans PV-1]KON47679.1 pyridine nucleotide transhydrogenase [Mariprofundus ferrooxydans]
MDYDILIVGSGPAGQHAAWQAARMGKRAAIIERKPSIGGAGLQTGTIPSKALREAAYLASRSGVQGMREASTAARHGVLAEAVRRKDMVIAQQESVIVKRLLKSGVALIPGEASFIDEHTLEVVDANGASRQLSADVILLATGSRPHRPSDIPFDKQTVLDSTSILKLKRLPKSLLVVGGGVIACEFVSIFAALGVAVSVVDSHAQLLAYLSEDVVAVLAESFDNMGVELHMQQRVVAVRREEGRTLTLLESGQKLYSEVVLYALGRVPNAQSLNTPKAGITLDQGWITVNKQFQSSVPHIYAVGDLIGRPALASTGMEQGRAAVLHAFGGSGQAMPANLPMAIYAIPEISWVGKTEKEAKRDQIDYVVGRGYYKESARGQIIGDANGLVKLIVDAHSHRLIGAHIVGEHASELIHTGQLLMNFNGTVHDLVANAFNYPTLAECYKLAALDCLSHLSPTPEPLL